MAELSRFPSLAGPGGDGVTHRAGGAWGSMRNHPFLGEDEASRGTIHCSCAREGSRAWPLGLVSSWVEEEPFQIGPGWRVPGPCTRPASLPTSAVRTAAAAKPLPPLLLQPPQTPSGRPLEPLHGPGSTPSAGQGVGSPASRSRSCRLEWLLPSHAAPATVLCHHTWAQGQLRGPSPWRLYFTSLRPQCQARRSEH